ncbi:hypothetical protein J5X98_00760 [Leptothermofonsia sichuanensis E412]|uniref:hypothetical protein n=1 Tax=Leptothermofonsia sichuanensis TaxID=2917832 RepID=UPI001CA704E9|nr:hypothetical protein [Leptothermofonsia sichuanensis]QZZ21077.1 hypothetical protein J5X98_00760 [Leptothermofonsia sichuanensis E412]
MKTDKPFRKAFICAGIHYLLIIIVAIYIANTANSANPPFNGELDRVLGICITSALITGLWARLSHLSWSWLRFAATYLLIFFMANLGRMG